MVLKFKKNSCATTKIITKVKRQIDEELVVYMNIKDCYIYHIKRKRKHPNKNKQKTWNAILKTRNANS